MKEEIIKLICVVKDEKYLKYIFFLLKTFLEV